MIYENPKSMNTDLLYTGLNTIFYGFISKWIILNACISVRFKFSYFSIKAEYLFILKPF